jgi:putative membrane protein
MKLYLAALLAPLFHLPGMAAAQTPMPKTQMPQVAPPSKGLQIGDTGQFIAKATMGNMFEIETSRVALEKASTEDVRNFAQTMITDHTKATQEREAILRENQATMPSSKLDADHQKQVECLKKAHIGQFDREYIALQTKAHDDAITLFRDYARTGTDALLKAFAQKMLPDLERHAARIKTIAQ